MWPKYLVLSAVVTVGSVYADDGEFRYFSDPELNYWNKKMVQAPVSTAPKSVVQSRETPTAFPWKNYIDPKKDEFFREGDYTPPAPFMEIARNPSDENIANWFQYLEMKNAITHRLQERLEAYAATRSDPSAARVRIPASTAPLTSAKDYRLRLYFDSKCPHCAHMLETMTELSRLGFWIELKQIDGDTSARSKIPFPVSSANPKELHQYKIESVPLLLVGNIKRGTFLKIQGYQTPTDVLQTLKSDAGQNFNQPKGGSS